MASRAHCGIGRRRVKIQAMGRSAAGADVFRCEWNTAFAQPVPGRDVMGLKELFGGGRKKAEFREKAKEVLAEGRIVPGKAEQIAQVAVQHAIEDAGDDKTMLRREVYNKAVHQAKKYGRLTDVEAQELAKIQKFLALRDDQVEKTQWDLTRLRTLTEIRQGKLPTVASSNVALRGVPLEHGEVAHYALQVEAFDRPNTGGRDGVTVKWATPWTINASKGHVLPDEGARSVGEGYLILTSRRLFFKGQGRSAAVRYSPQANLFLYTTGLRLERDVGHTLLRFRTSSEDTAEIVGELLAALMR
jgi:hypothetical protein